MSRAVDILNDPTIERRFWAKVTVGLPDECWVWTASTHMFGYGQVSVGGRAGRPVQAHRVAWVLRNGEVPDGLYVLHRCDNPPCVNPAHLFLGTTTDNMRDMALKGRASGWPKSCHTSEKQSARNRLWLARVRGTEMVCPPNVGC